MNLPSPASTASPPPPALTHTLRWWPAALLVLAMLLLRMIPAFVESPSLPVIFTSFLGPAVAALLVLGWWLAISRATIRERILGAVGTVALIAVAILLLHPTLSGMSAIMYVLPYGFAAFAITLCLLAPRPSLRLPVALAAVALTVGYWDLLQSAGVDGTFQPELSWRWEPTAEERFLQTVAATPTTPAPGDSAATPSVEAITLASSPWPAFRGPLRDGRQPGIVLNADWEQAPPKPIWKKPIGPGWSSFSVAGNRLFTQEQRGDDEAVVCLDATTGDVLWVSAYPSRFWEAVAGAGPRGTPTIADEGLFALGANGVLVSLDPLTGSKRWSRDLQKDADRKPPMWGFASSPLVTQGLVIVHAGGAGNKGVLAYRATDGELAWSVPS
ncbi:MAG: alcohol dehydrogenase, partial [Planctomyces sp.]|nr:alcohol dehydrogenase [Planctomyces sp.]